MPIALTDLLLEIPYEMKEYVSFVEDVAYDQLLRANLMAKSGMAHEDMVELFAKFRLDFPKSIKREFPLLTSLQIELTCQLTYDCIEKDECLDYLYSSMYKAIAIRDGKKFFTIDLDLPITGAQLN